MKNKYSANSAVQLPYILFNVQIIWRWSAFCTIKELIKIETWVDKLDEIEVLFHFCIDIKRKLEIKLKRIDLSNLLWTAAAVWYERAFDLLIITWKWSIAKIKLISYVPWGVTRMEFPVKGLKLDFYHY